MGSITWRRIGRAYTKTSHSTDIDDYPKPTNEEEEMMSLGHFPYPIVNQEDRVPQLCLYVYGSM